IPAPGRSLAEIFPEGQPPSPINKLWVMEEPAKQLLNTDEGPCLSGRNAQLPGPPPWFSMAMSVEPMMLLSILKFVNRVRFVIPNIARGTNPITCWISTSFIGGAATSSCANSPDPAYPDCLPRTPVA